MSGLFEPFQLKGVTLPNRLVRSATFDNSAERDGQVSQRQLTLYGNLAQGGVGLVVSGIVYVHESGRVAMRQNSLADDQGIPGLAKLVDAVHAHGGKIAVQLFHAGREAARFRQFTGGEPAWAPSLVEHDPYFEHPHRAMTAAEIEEVVAAFGAAARRAKEAGFDAVQVHGAHAYLFAQFLSPHANRRDDQWGGSLDNRLRLHLAALDAIREQVGPEYPVMIKLGLADGFEPGLSFDDGLEAAVRLARAGYDCLEISQGLRGADYRASEFRPEDKRAEQEGYFRAWAAEVKQRVSVPVIAVGGLRTPAACAEVLDRGQADLVALSRPLISQPDLVARWQEGSQERSRCISCNKCMEVIIKGKALSCILDQEPSAA
ncbi:MAG: NADH:flavin oxidoreductase [Desulfarculaceae bacterium]|nr:NADH:flavin oxidoreductase [Desulfarculaceae bacterium]MCF8071680.1 NADH:flavin oxidoreductase [Desulfarculaceae bacterium]MCF8102473.1 NADH:flavin oxidoreductase [Desulfarculaceae bacterium]MCF8116815.1 NADH:flavin oxidoreductase [Desulfarculaceae bacterium]